MSYSRTSKWARWPKQEIARILNEVADLPKGLQVTYLKKTGLASSVLFDWRRKFGYRGEKIK